MGYYLNILPAFVFSFIFNILFIRHTPQVVRYKQKAFMGGLSFAFSTLVCGVLGGIFFSFPQDFFAVLIGSFLMLAVGIWDDVRELTPSAKFLMHTAVIGIYCLSGGKPILFNHVPSTINYLLTFLWLAGITNAVNHLDIRDGLSSGITFIMGIFLTFIAFIVGSHPAVLILISLLASMAAFMIFNLPPAKIYMGNTGSHFLGFLLASAAIYLDYSQSNILIALSIPIGIFLIPVLDTGILIILRLRKGVSVTTKTDDHFFYYCERRFGLSRALYLFWGATFLCGLLACIAFLSSFRRI